MAEPWQLSAAEIAAAVRAGELSAVETVESLLDRIYKLEPRVFAWETLDPDGAVEAAIRSDELRAQSGAVTPRDISRPDLAALTLLTGVPFGVKDIYFTRGLRTTAGSALFMDFVPQHDATAVARLRSAGAIVLGKTVTTTFAYMDPAPTRNPWNPKHTPGGSSAGAAAAVAARMVPASLGTQTAGSVLRPAAYCGVIGLKPSFGRISRYGVFPAAWSLDTMGVLARTVEDAALFLGAMAGYDPRDPMSSEEPAMNYLAPLRRTIARPPRLALMRDYLDRSTPAVRQHLEDVARRLEQSGAKVREAALPMDLDTALAAHHVTMQVETGAAHAFQLARFADLYPPRIRAYAEAGLLVPGSAYVQAQRVRRRLRMGVDALLNDVDALILPTASGPPPDTTTTGDPTFQAIFTFLGLPAISLPTGLTAEGVPLATQLVSRRFAESQLIGTAGWIERTIGLIPSPEL